MEVINQDQYDFPQPFWLLPRGAQAIPKVVAVFCAQHFFLPRISAKAFSADVHLSDRGWFLWLGKEDPGAWMRKDTGGMLQPAPVCPQCALIMKGPCSNNVNVAGNSGSWLSFPLDGPGMVHGTTQAPHIPFLGYVPSSRLSA